MEDLQRYIAEHIPIVARNGFRIDAGPEGPSVLGTYRDHINHRNSVFGGSLSNALILASWAAVRTLVVNRGLTGATVVIQSQTVDFLKPVVRDFRARASALGERETTRFFALLDRFGKGRLIVDAVVTHQDDSEELARFRGEFVVVIPRVGDVEA